MNGPYLLHRFVDHRPGQSFSGAVEHGPDRAVGMGEDGCGGPAQQRRDLEPRLPRYDLTDRMIELGFATSGRPMGDPADFGKVVAFLCSQAAGNLSGARIIVDGGESLAL